MGEGLIDYRFVLMRTKDNGENLLQMADSFEHAGADWLKSFGLQKTASRVIAQITEFVRSCINQMEVGERGIFQLHLEIDHIMVECARKRVSDADFQIKGKAIALTPSVL